MTGDQALGRNRYHDPASLGSHCRIEKGKPGESRGRKAKGLTLDSGFWILDFGLSGNVKGQPDLDPVASIQNPKSKIQNPDTAAWLPKPLADLCESKRPRP